jgi:hypothetical protein
VVSGLFRPLSAFGTAQQVLLKRCQLGFVHNHSKVVAFKIVIGNVVHASIVAERWEILTKIAIRSGFHQPSFFVSYRVRAIASDALKNQLSY